MTSGDPVVCTDDEHSDHEPERHGHVRVLLHAAGRSGRGRRDWHVARQRLRSARLPRLALETPALEFSHHVELQHRPHSHRAFPGCRLSRLVQQQRKNLFIYAVSYTAKRH